MATINPQNEFMFLLDIKNIARVSIRNLIDNTTNFFLAYDT